MLGISVLGIGAQELLRWTWYSQDEKVAWFRYQLNAQEQDGWTVVDSTVTSVAIETDYVVDEAANKVATLYVQGSYDGVNWSVSGRATYIKERFEPTFTIKTTLSPYTLALYRFYNGYNTASTRTKTNSVYGFNAALELDFTLQSWLRLYPELAYSLILKSDTIIPGQQAVQYLKAGVGVDFTFTTNKTTLYAGAFAGAMAHINNKKVSLTPYFGARLGYEFNLNGHWVIGAQSRVTFALFSGRSQSLMDSMTVLIDPVGITVSYRL